MSILGATPPSLDWMLIHSLDILLSRINVFSGAFPVLECGARDKSLPRGIPANAGRVVVAVSHIQLF